jgi:TolB-like protein
MKTRARPCFTALLLLAASGCRADSLRQAAEKIKADLADRPQKRVAVLAFPYHDGRLSSGSTILQERLTTFLAEDGKLDVVERSLVDKILEERRWSGSLTAEEAKDIGRILGASALVAGTLNDLDENTVEVNARAVDVETGKILTAARAETRRTWSDAPIRREERIVPGRASGKRPVVQIALLLDTSNSMDGLIAQAKSQLWKVVNELASARCRGRRPLVQVALYEYGNDNLSPESHYVRQVLPFTADLDEVSERLFGLTTRGGSEYCGAVLRSAADRLDWDRDPGVYKAIFIAGNEPFDQGPVDYRRAIAPLAARGVVANTIFCGPRREGSATAWEDGARAGRGDYLNIDASGDVIARRAPQDDEIARLGLELSRTYVAYGDEGRRAARRQAAMDAAAEGASAAAAPVERSIFKAGAQYAEEARWDLLGRLERKEIKIGDVSDEDLPAELRGLGAEELEKHARKTLEERKALEARIADLSRERKKFLAVAAQSSDGKTTLDEAVLSCVRSQAAAKGFKFE